MKKVIILAIALTLVTAGIAFAAVSGSKHDMTGNSGVTSFYSGTQICVFCHHPHRGATTTATGNALLWNINDDSASYTTYAKTDTMNDNYTQTTLTEATGKPQTLLCMGCHDGSTSTNTFIAGSSDGGGFDGGEVTNLNFVNPAANLGESLEEDHPVGFTYPAAATTGHGDLADASGDLVPTANNTYPLFGGQMECATCHDVHAGTPDGTDSKSLDIQFMRGDTANSEICIDCHTTK